MTDRPSRLLATKMEKAWHAVRQIAAMPLLLYVCMAATSCHPNTRYNEYRHIDAEGWDRDSVLCFDVAPMEEGGTYVEGLHLRTDNHYPFRQLMLVVDQEILPSHRHVIDSLTWHLYDDDGDNEGRGFSLFQKEKIFRFLTLQSGDSLHVTIQHGMRRHIVPGVHDIGLSIDR